MEKECMIFCLYLDYYSCCFLYFNSTSNVLTGKLVEMIYFILEAFSKRESVKKIFTIRFALDNLILFFGFITHSPLNALKKRNTFERLSLCNSSYNYQRKTLLQ